MVLRPMIIKSKGNLFSSNAEAYINTVNTVGVMGKGIALQFKERFPENYVAYRKACKEDQVQIGSMFVTKVEQIQGPKWIINFPTKKHWKGKSKIEFIEKGLEDLINVIIEKDIKSVAMPPLGAGNGGLEWETVKEVIFKKLENKKVTVELFEPSFKVIPQEKREKVNLTKARAIILSLIKKYKVLGFEVTHLEVQKLAYFMQRFGQHDLRLQYKKYKFGPYAYNLQHLLSQLEGSYILGNTKMLDAKALDSLYLIKERVLDFESYLESNTNEFEKARLDNVKKLIEGFESPFGLELLSTVDWVVNNKEADINDPAELQKVIFEWNSHKATSIKVNHIGVAVNRLKEFSSQLY